MRNSQATRRMRFRANLRLLKEQQGCAQCGSRSDLVHHHLRDNRADVSKMHNYSLEAVIDEIGKCIVLCRPCHTALHAGRRNVEVRSVS